VRAVSELFPGTVVDAGSWLRVTSSQPVRAMGLRADAAAASVLPVAPVY
jgi:hypothetical protein